MARRLVAQQCLDGVDKNPFAVNLAKLSLWLVTLSRDMPFTFLDRALKCGDSLVGRTRRDYAGMVQLQPEPMMSVSARLRERVVPFNWEIKFPEVFDRENGGFDAIVGNPPFAGKNTTTSGNAEGYPDWLKDTYAESHGNSDLVAFFFRQSFDLLRFS